MFKPNTFAFTALLAALTALGPLSTDLYLPVLPDIGRAFGVPPAQVQLTLSAYLIGFAAGQIAYGPISDWYGRRSGLLIAILCYCAGALICFLSPSIDVLIGARVLQAFGASGATVLARAVVRDLYSGARAGKELSLMSLVMAAGPVSAPLIGGTLHFFFGWRSAFAALLAVGAVVLATVWRKLPETLGERVSEQLSIGTLISGYRQMLQHRVFVLYLLIGAAAYTCLLVWLTTAPFILQNLYGLTPLRFAVIFTLCGCGFLVGNLFATRKVLRVGIVRMIGYGASIMVTGGTIVCLLIALDLASVVTLVAAMAFTLIGFGMVFPLALAGGLSCFSDRAGAASSLLGFSPQFMAAIVCTLVAFAMNRSVIVAGIAILAMTLVVFGLWLLLRRAAPQAR
ncbi:multidrug effflux MFS transporter [Pseudorhodoplanes sinuspersici]|uniref:Bcr/CflA family efflux transporter n=1 Tax=Pseudorhodoplanes sinuspersici TaxID=1235591 RepID=A0A1W6ZNL1_9HYPH|nr:multidrug effflux MFS transporter [Pseudorhodoplanes sinuspersici]ARP98730.1 hypothetical protein CAK95_06295 [Pseudorhodoplanes sinuspersici]RKE69664.1 DHA1 family bicyclomycin/chloramphenicol resistance-like MFS transporter [Pseudorhodoplanes sinuspersici]